MVRRIVSRVVVIVAASAVIAGLSYVFGVRL